MVCCGAMLSIVRQHMPPQLPDMHALRLCERLGLDAPVGSSGGVLESAACATLESRWAGARTEQVHLVLSGHICDGSLKASTLRLLEGCRVLKGLPSLLHGGDLVLSRWPATSQTWLAVDQLS